MGAYGAVPTESVRGVLPDPELAVIKGVGQAWPLASQEAVVFFTLEEQERKVIGDVQLVIDPDGAFVPGRDVATLLAEEVVQRAGSGNIGSHRRRPQRE